MFLACLNEHDKKHRECKELRTGIIAGSLCPPSLMKRIIDDLNISEITNCYGMTETSPVSF
jgi:fatty-acyl-CoA synthase